ncbi:MAG: ABC transporter permease, partial [Gemmatimonadaceae bacterium]
ILFGLAPALRGSRMEIATTLRNDSAGAGRGRSRLRNALVIGQVAMSLLLLTVSGLFVRALDKGRRVQLGIDVSNVASAALNVGIAGYDTTRGRQFYRDLSARLATEPGVEQVAFARLLPLSMNVSEEDVEIPGFVPKDSRDGKTTEVMFNVVDDGYFGVTRMKVVTGRGFLPSDNENAAQVVVLNESFARKYWPDQQPIGKTLKLNDKPLTVVGIVRDSKYNKLDEKEQPFMFLPYAQHWLSDVNLLVRTKTDAAQMASTIRRELHGLDANLPNPTVTTLQQATAVVLLPQRVAVLVTGVLGLAGLALAGIGLYGVISFSAAQRTREIGVRVALGAGRRDVLRLVVGEGMSMVGIGMGIGLVLALIATRALTSFLFGVSPLDAFTFIAVAAILGATALFASYLPARRAAIVDPVVALRQE